MSSSLSENYLPQDHVQSLAKIEQGYWWFVGRIEATKQLIRSYAPLASLPGMQYIDVGCGTGGFAEAIRNSFPVSRLGLIDGDPNVLAHAKSYQHAEIFQRDLTKPLALPFKPHLVTAMDVIEHLEEDGKFLKGLAQEMTSRSALILSVPALPSLFSEWDRQLGHYRRYTLTELQTKLLEAGFQIQRLTYKWSFLTPMGLARKFRSPRYQKTMEFESVPRWLNQILILLSKVEDNIPDFLKPVGTSLIALVTKP